MKAVFIVFLIATSLSCMAQKQSHYSIDEIRSIAKKYGTDSAIKVFFPVIDISFLDTAFSLDLAKQCDPMYPNHIQEEYFSLIARKIKDTSLVSKTVAVINSYNGRLKTYAWSQDFNSLPDKLFEIILFQDDSSVVSSMHNGYSEWQRAADSLRNFFPSSFKRFFQRFSNHQPPVVENYRACKMNAYLFAFTLNHFKVESFTDETIRKLNNEVGGNDQQILVKPRTYPVSYDTIQLTGNYPSLSKINFQEEPSLAKYKFYADNNYCWQKIFIQNETALYAFGCSMGRGAGMGEVIMAKLISPDKLQISVIGGWIN